jgi:hypothetical protein
MMLFSVTVACLWWWLLWAGLLLLVQLLASPSPPGSAPGLSFSSWTCSWASDGLHSVCWLFSDVLWLLWENCGVIFCVECELLPWWYSSGRLLALLAVVVLPAPASPSVTKLLVSYVPAYTSSLVWSIPWPCCETAMCSFDLYPSGF